MSAKVSKALRRMAREEMAGDPGCVDRELVIATVRGHDRVINNPNSVRAMTNALKAALKKARQKGSR